MHGRRTPTDLAPSTALREGGEFYLYGPPVLCARREAQLFIQQVAPSGGGVHVVCNVDELRAHCRLAGQVWNHKLLAAYGSTYLEKVVTSAQHSLCRLPFSQLAVLHYNCQVVGSTTGDLAILHPERAAYSREIYGVCT